MNSFRRKIGKVVNSINLKNLKSIGIYIKNKGIKGLYGTCINKIRFGKVVLDEYATWIANNEPNKSELEKQKNTIFPQTIKFSVYGDSIIDLSNQTYSVFDVNLLQRETIGELIKNSDSDYIIFKKNNIEFAPFFLYELVLEIEKSDAYLIYSDNDKLIEEKRWCPNFKPDFAIDTLRSKNYIGDFIAIKTKFLRYNLDILNDLSDEYIYDLTFKVSEKTNKITHIPKILYHEKYIEKNVNTSIEKNVIKKHLERANIEYDSILDGKYENQYKINYKILEKPLISLVIPNKDHIDDLDKLLKSLEKTTYLNYEIIIVENNSKNDNTFEYYEKIKKENDKINIVNFEISYFNYSSIVNFGVKKSKGEYIVLLNNDIELLTEDWIEELLMYTQRKDVGICGAKLYFEDRSIQHAGVTIGTRGLAGHRYREVHETDFSKDDYINIVQDLSAVTAACFMVEKKLYDELLGFDEKLAVAFNDVDFCLKVRNENYLIVYNPFVEAYHYESKSRGEDTQSLEKQQRFAREFEFFVRRWNYVIARGDPYYNKNYRLDLDVPKINYNKIN